MGRTRRGAGKSRLPFVILIMGSLLLAAPFVSGCLAASGESSGGNHAGGPAGTEGGSVTITDSLGNTVTLPRPAQRIICQNGMAAELLVAMGSGDRIVGITDALLTERYVTTKIPQAQSIGQWDNPDIERILALKPDVMLVYSSKTTNIDAIRAANITVIYLDCNRLRDVPKEARKLGALTGNPRGAEGFARYIEGYLDLVNARLANLTDADRPHVYIEMYSDYQAQGRGSTGDAILTLAGARNIGENITTSAAVVNPDWIIQQDPDIIIKYVSRSDNLTLRYDSVKNRPLFSGVKAIRNNRVYAIKGDVVSGPRGVAGLIYIAKAVYPDRFSDLDPDTILKEYADSFIIGSDDVPTYYPPPQSPDGKWAEQI